MGRNILIIDDDPVIRHILESILSAEGDHVTAAPSGEAAFEILDAMPKPIPLDLIICDLMMPGMSGIDVMSRLKLHTDTQKIPLVMLTAEKHTEDMMEGYLHGADYYMTKPFTREQLLFGISVVQRDPE